MLSPLRGCSSDVLASAFCVSSIRSRDDGYHPGCPSEAKDQRGQQAAERRQHVAQRVSAGTRIGQKSSRGAATACSPAREGVLPNCAHVEYAVSQAHGESCPPVDRFGCARQSPVFAAKLEAIARDGVGQHTRKPWGSEADKQSSRGAATDAAAP